MVAEALDAQVRAAAFAFLSEQVRMLGSGVIPRRTLELGFAFGHQRVPLIGPQGIFKPAILSKLPLSITTVPVIAGKERPYDDGFEGDDLTYRYRGTDPRHRDNVGLRLAMERQVPLAYFHGITPGRYLAFWPVYVVGDDPRTHTFTVRYGEAPILTGDHLEMREDAERRYSFRMVRQRVHQEAFRERVLAAYRESCSVCNLHHRPLLDAAHILPDGHPHGLPTVPNGLALCKLHHAAFDANILGVRPDRVIEIRKDILDEVDGPMLRHGLQGTHGQSIHVPRRAEHQPNSDYLLERYSLFRQAI